MKKSTITRRMLAIVRRSRSKQSTIRMIGPKRQLRLMRRQWRDNKHKSQPQVQVVDLFAGREHERPAVIFTVWMREAQT